MIRDRISVDRDALVSSPLLVTTLIHHHEVNEAAKDLLNQSTGNSTCPVPSSVVQALLEHLCIADRRGPSL